MAKYKKTKAKHIKFLNELQLHGTISVYGAAPILMEAFPKLSSREANLILTDWMTNWKSYQTVEL